VFVSAKEKAWPLPGHAVGTVLVEFLNFFKEAGKNPPISWSSGGIIEARLVAGSVCGGDGPDP